MREKRQTQPIKPGDVFGECPKCGEMWERFGTQWRCGHCGHAAEANPDGTLKQKQLWTPEPLSVSEGSPDHGLIAGDRLVAMVTFDEDKPQSDEERTATAYRLRDCYNACAGVPTLAPGVVKELADALRAIVDNMPGDTCIEARAVLAKLGAA